VIRDAWGVVDMLRQKPSAATLAWVAREIGSGARVVTVRRLTGGIASSVHQLCVVDAKSGTHRLVLKRWLGEDQVGALAEFERERTALVALEHTDLPAPRLVASSPEGADGCPAVLMTRVRGRVDLVPREPRRWLSQMATTLARIHAAQVEVPAIPWWRAERQGAVPVWSTRPELWEAAGRILEGPAPSESCFIHGDYQHFNLLWARGRLTGVVDWAWAGLGHPARDVGHCRLNLAVLYSADLAHQLAAAYEAEAGRKVETWWDLHEIFRYSDEWPRFIPIQVAHRSPVDIGGMNERVEELLAASLARP
jgi:aminoglycoside phosphotransferase (APT) family kinase protein